MKKLFFLAAAAAMAMVSCDKGTGGGNPADGGKARMNVVISFPEAMSTRVDDTNASDKDVAIETVTVFVFDEDGNGVLGNATTFELADFDDMTGNRFELKAENRIQTTAGLKHVYVGINLPDGLSGAASESVLIDEASTAGLEGDASVAMLSELATPTLVSQEDSDANTPASNVVAAEVKRLVSKIAVTMGDEEEFTLNESDPSGATFTITPDQFAVGGLATTFYPVERLPGGMLETPGDAVDTTEPALRAINAKGTPVADRDAFYVPEHADMTREYMQSDLTHVVVRAEFTFTKFASVGNDGVKFTDAGVIPPNGFAYVFRHGEDTYVCQSSLIAGQVKNELLGEKSENVTYIADENGKFYTYYFLFLNQNESDMLAVHRNQFFDITVTGAKGLGGSTATPPDEPLVETTYLEVSVDVLEWDHKPMDRVLGE